MTPKNRVSFMDGPLLGIFYGAVFSLDLLTLFHTGSGRFVTTRGGVQSTRTDIYLQNAADMPRTLPEKSLILFRHYLTIFRGVWGVK